MRQAARIFGGILVLILRAERMSSIGAWRVGGKGRERRSGVEVGEERRAEMKLGKRVLGWGWRVKAEKAVGKSVI